MPVDAETLRAALADHLSHNTDGTYVCKWAAVVEVMEPDGTRALLILTPEDQTAWDTAGLLAYANPHE